MANAYLEKIEKAFNVGFNDGLRVGAQSYVDCMAKVLNEHGWGYDRIIDLTNEIQATRSEFSPMIDVRKPDCDYYRERIDRALKQIIGKRDGFLSFHERYPELAEAKTGIKNKMVERIKNGK